MTSILNEEEITDACGPMGIGDVLVGEGCDSSWYLIKDSDHRSAGDVIPEGKP